MKRNLNCDDKLIHQYQQNDQSPQIIEDKKEHAALNMSQSNNKQTYHQLEYFF
jgi:hypothetical protein